MKIFPLLFQRIDGWLGIYITSTLLENYIRLRVYPHMPILRPHAMQTW